jgi:hypothetical protein
VDEGSEALERLVDERDLDGLLARVSIDEIADAWWRYQLRHAGDAATHDDGDWWAVELWLSGGPIYESETAVRGGLVALIDRAPERADVGLVGAEPLENFVTNDEDRIVWIEDWARRSDSFKMALANVWVDHLSPETFDRIEQAAGTQLARRGDTRRTL